MKSKTITIFGKDIKEYKHVLLLLYYIVIGIMYIYVNKAVLPEDIEVLMRFPAIDDKIPFVKYMVVPYYIWYLYIIFPLAYFAFKDKKAFIQLALYLFSSTTLVYIFFILVPNGIGIGFRPEITETDIFSRMIAYIYSIDNPTNSCPSLHVLNTLAVHSAIMNSQVLKDKKLILNSSKVLAVLICASTVMIKQHSIIDVAASLLLGTFLYYVIYSSQLVSTKINELSYD